MYAIEVVLGVGVCVGLHVWSHVSQIPILDETQLLTYFSAESQAVSVEETASYEAVCPAQYLRVYQYRWSMAEVSSIQTHRGPVRGGF
jgi:hypothetical protein